MKSVLDMLDVFLVSPLIALYVKYFSDCVDWTSSSYLRNGFSLVFSSSPPGSGSAQKTFSRVKSGQVGIDFWIGALNYFTIYNVFTMGKLQKLHLGFRFPVKKFSRKIKSLTKFIRLRIKRDNENISETILSFKMKISDYWPWKHIARIILEENKV